MKLILICGAPRSGTTFLYDLIENEQLCMFPGESRIPQYYFHDLENVDTFFRRDYLNTFEIQSLINHDLKRDMNDYRQKIYKSKKKRETKFDIDSYLSNLSVLSFCLRDIYAAVVHGLGYQDSRNLTLVVKMPLENEILAIKIANEIPDAKFIHITRNPKTRYISAKMRNKRRGFIVGKGNFAIKHASVSMLSDELLCLNYKALGKERYLPIGYECLTSSIESNMRRIAEFIGIEWNESMLYQTNSPSSTFGKPNAEDRIKRFKKVTSRSERSIIDFFEMGIPLKPSDFILPYKYENPLHYIGNRKEMMKLRGISGAVKINYYHDMLDRFNNGEDIGD